MRREDLHAITFEDLLRFDPCYYGWQLAKVKNFAKSRPAWNVLDILDVQDYPLTDILWVVLRQPLLPLKWLHEIAFAAVYAASECLKMPLTE